MSDPAIPLATLEYEEWGNPAIKAQYEYMLSYSPYDNVAAHPYPAMFVTTGLNDSRVLYAEPAKMGGPPARRQDRRQRPAVEDQHDLGP
jgi:oligopeptidase B